MTLDAWLRLWTGPAGGSAGGLGAAMSAFERFASGYARLATAPAVTTTEWETLARGLVADLLPGGLAGSPGMPAEAGIAAATLASATAAGFARRLADPGARPATLRMAFDAWVDAAEEAFRAVAFTDGFAGAQAALCQDLVRLRSAQQSALNEAMRLAGLPDRAEVDALHDTVRELRAALAAREQAPPRRRRKAK